MFDIGFWELILVAVVALLVIGPERLPGVARTAGLWLGRGRRMIMEVKSDIDRELKAEEIKRMLDQQKASASLHEIARETQASVDRLKVETESILEPQPEQSAPSAKDGKETR